MSLVNDALQKVHAQTAQRQAAGAAVPGAVPYRFNKPRREPSRVWWVAVGAVVFAGLAVVVAIVLVRRPSQAMVAPVAVAVPVAVTPVRQSVPVVIQAPATQPAVVAAPPIVPVQPIVSTPVPVATTAPAALPMAAVPTTQPAPTSVSVPMEAAPVAAAAAPPATAPAPAPSTTSVPAPTAAPVTAVIDLQSLNVPGLGKLKLTGIALSPFGTRAVINGTIISVGDTVGPATITDIQDKRVKLDIGGKTYTLSLP